MHKSPSISNDIPASGEGIRGEDGRIGYLLRQANAAHRSQVEKLLQDLDVTLPQYSVLSFCKLYPGLSNADLARLTLLTPQTVCVIVANLERKGAISRRPHAVHGRIQQIDLTAAGRTLLDQCDKPILAFQQELVADLSPSEEAIIRRWLIKLATTYA